MMTICSKFGTRGTGVAVNVGEGVNVAVGGIGVDVVEGVGEGVEDGAGGIQAASKTNRRAKTQKRFITSLFLIRNTFKSTL